MFGGIVAIGVGIAIGMYIASQIGVSINKNIERNNLIQNLKKWDEEEKRRRQK